MLLNLLWTEFHHVLKDTKQHRYSSQAPHSSSHAPLLPKLTTTTLPLPHTHSMLLLSEGEEPDGRGGYEWLRVTAQSDIPLVLQRASLKLVERRGEEDEERYDVAYPVEDAPEPEEVSRPSRGRREKGTPKKGGGGGRCGNGRLDSNDSIGGGGVRLPGGATAMERFDDEEEEEGDDGAHANGGGANGGPARFVDSDEDEDEAAAGA